MSTAKAKNRSQQLKFPLLGCCTEAEVQGCFHMDPWTPWLCPCLGTGLLPSALGPLPLTSEETEPHEHQPLHHYSFCSNPSKRVFMVYMHPWDAPGREP